MKKVLIDNSNGLGRRTGALSIGSTLPDSKHKQIEDRSTRLLNRNQTKIDLENKKLMTNKLNVCTKEKKLIDALKHSWAMEGQLSPHLLRRRAGSKYPERIMWSGVHMQSRQRYIGQRPDRPRAIKRLWRLAECVRQERETQGFSQAALTRSLQALDCEGVIYALYSPGDNRTYVGLTVGSALSRFEKHVQCARAGSDKPVHLWISNRGFRNVFVFPLEHVPIPEARNWETRKALFRKVASLRELFWIKHIHSGRLRTNGLNVQGGTRKNSLHAGFNPMKWRSKKLSVLPVEYNEVVDLTLDKKCGRRSLYRNWERRCKFLMSHITKGTFEAVKLRHLKRENLQAMATWLEESKTWKPLLLKLRHELLLRHRPSEMKDRKDVSRRFDILWQSKLLQKIGIRSLLKDDELKSFLPNDFRDVVGSVSICHKLTKPLGALLYNYKHEAKNMFSPKSPCTSCPCRSFSTSFRPDEGCVWTGDLTIVRNIELRQLIAYGPKFRLATDCDPMSVLEESVDSFVAALCEKHEGTMRSEFTPWKTELLTRARERLLVSPHSAPDRSDFSTEITQLKRLQRLFVLVPADKAANNTIFICKRLYCHLLREELQKKGGAYSAATESHKEVLMRHKEQLNRWNISSCDILPYLYWLPKMHKVPFGCRFISASGRCSTTSASSILCKMLSCVHETIISKNDRLLLETGVRRHFVIKDAFEASDFLSRWPRTKSSLQLHTFDFATMYTNIPLEDLCTRIGSVIDEAVAELGDCKHEWMMEVSIFGDRVSNATWVDCKRTCVEKSDKILSVRDLKDLCHFVVYNAYVNNRDCLLNQSVGIPMGTNAAPPLANLYLYSYEAEYIDRICEEDHGIARDFHLSFRLLDDLLSVDNVHHEAFSRCREDGGVYPKTLVCGLTNKSVDKVQFCGLNIENQKDTFAISVYDKKSVFPFHVKNYPHARSNIPRTILYSAFTGQLHRFYRLCNTLQGFFQSVKEMYVKLVTDNECTPRVLSWKFRSFISRMTWKFSTRKSIVLSRFRDLSSKAFPAPSTSGPMQSADSTLPEPEAPQTSGRSGSLGQHLKPDIQKTSGGCRDLQRLELEYLQDPRAWLRDEDIANICNEIRKQWTRRPWSAFASIDWRFHYPVTLAALLFDMTLYFHDLHLSPSVTFIPLNIGNSHWTLLALDSRPGKMAVVFWDPLGRACPHRAWTHICSFFDCFRCIDLVSRLQYDGFQCGVWVCWAIDVLISSTLDAVYWSVPNLSTLFGNAISLNFYPARLRDGQATFIEEVREAFVTSIQHAASSGSLLVEYVRRR